MDEAKNKFQKHDENRAAHRNSTQGVTRADAVAVREKIREKWTGHGQENQWRNGGLLLDEKTIAAKNAALAARGKSTLPPAVTTMTPKSMEAIVERWSQETNFYASQFNMASLINRLHRDVEAGLPFSCEMLNNCAEWLRSNNHLEQPPTTVRKRREIISSATPTLYEFTTVEEQALLDEQQTAKAIADRAREDQANRNLPLDQLRRKTQKVRGTISGESYRRGIGESFQG